MAARAGQPARVRARLEPRHVRLLQLLAAASFFQGYDLNVITIALPSIRRTFGLSQARASDWLALLAVGALPALLLARRADRIGRRRLLVSIAGFTAATAASAAAPTIVTFGCCQLTGTLARSVAVLAVGPLLAAVVVALGFPETAGLDLDQTSAETV